MFADTSFVPPLVYAVFGTSRNIAIGPVAVVALLLGEMLKKELSPTADAAQYLRLAFTATFFAGVVQAALGILRYVQLFSFHMPCYSDSLKQCIRSSNDSEH